MRTSAFAALAVAFCMSAAPAAMAQTPAAADRTWGASPTDFMSAPLNNANLQWSPGQVRQALEQQGYTVLATPVLSGNDYIVRALRNGVEQTFRVDSFNGSVSVAGPLLTEVMVRRSLTDQGFEILRGPDLQGTKYSVRTRKQGVTQDFLIDANTGAVERAG